MKIIAFDLDYTFLDENKDISERNMSALMKAKEQGIEPVPATGRLFVGIPEALRKVCRYFITINGAKVIDSLTGDVIYDASIPTELALKVYDHAEGIDCLYDAYIGGSAYMTGSMRKILLDYVHDKHYGAEMRDLRVPVPNLKEYISENNLNVQKAQYFFKDSDIEIRDREMEVLSSLYPELKVSFSMVSNIEINSCKAGKGVALEALCRHLGVGLEDAVAFGDGKNDDELIEYAGTGFCMKNGHAHLKTIADAVTEFDCNHSGVGAEIEKLLR